MNTTLLAAEPIDHPEMPPIGNPDAMFGMAMTGLGLIVPVVLTLMIVIPIVAARKEQPTNPILLLAPAASGLALSAFLLVVRWLVDPRTETDHALNVARHVPGVWLTALTLLPAVVGIALSVQALLSAVRARRRVGQFSDRDRLESVGDSV